MGQGNLSQLARALKKQADLSWAITSSAHLEHLLHDEFINWLIISHPYKQAKDEKGRI